MYILMVCVTYLDNDNCLFGRLLHIRTIGVTYPDYCTFLDDGCYIYLDGYNSARHMSQISGVSIVYWNISSGAGQRKHQGSSLLAFVRGNSPVTVEFPSQRASDAENVSIWWRHHDTSRPRPRCRPLWIMDWYAIYKGGKEQLWWRKRILYYLRKCLPNYAYIGKRKPQIT